MSVNWTKTVERYILEGRTVSGACGASGDQKSIAASQKQNFEDFANESQQIFGNSSQIFKDITSNFEPVLAAGPDQNGLSVPELAALKSQAVTNAGNAYRNAARATGERIAASGGGNAVLPSGQSDALMRDVAIAGAGKTADALTNIDIQNKEIGRQNWMNAAGVLAGSLNVFNPSINSNSSTTGSGSAAMSGANTVQQANRQWVGDVTGILGDVAGVASSFIPGAKSAGGGGNNAGIVSGDVTYS